VLAAGSSATTFLVVLGPSVMTLVLAAVSSTAAPSVVLAWATSGEEEMTRTSREASVAALCEMSGG
jgi:hypothetical protein